jgi:hypothetical protein
MSIYDVLADSFLYNEREAEEQYRRYSDDDLRAELARYRNAIDTALPDLAALTPRKGALRLIPKDGRVDLSLLTQCAWYVPEMIVADPLYALTGRETVGHQAFGHLLGFDSQSDTAWRTKIVRAVDMLRTLVPAVVAGYVNIVPWSRLTEPPAMLPIVHSDVLFRDALPEPLMRWCVERARVRSVTMDNGAAVVEVTPPGPVLPTRRIAIAFAPSPEGPVEDEAEELYMYTLVEQRILAVDDSTRTFRAFAHIPDEAPSEEDFGAWVRQSTHQSAAKFVRRIIAEAKLAAANDAHYLTDSSTASALLDITGSGRSDQIRTTVLNAMLSFELPFIPEASLRDVMIVRQQDGEAFMDFRLHLESRLRELELETDPEIARRKAEHIRHELAEVQVRAIERQMPRLRQRAAADAVIAVGTLAASVVTGGLSLIGSAIAAGSLIKTKAEYEETVVNNPAHFLWKVRRRVGVARRH